MADNDAQTLEGTEAKVENAPPPTDERKIEVAPNVGAEPAAASGKAPVAEPPNSDQATIRSVFVARTTALSAASVGGFAQMDTTDEGLAVRGAYRAHLSVMVAEAVAGDPATGDDVLRKAYLARAIANAEAQPRPKRRAARSAKRTVARSGKKAPGTKAKRHVATASSVKAKKRSAKPRAAARRPPRGKRRGR
jgi:hypothetical protein